MVCEMVCEMCVKDDVYCCNGRISHGLLCEIQCEIPCEKKNVPCLKKMCEIVNEIACENACGKDNICHTLFTWFSHTLHMFFTC